MKLPIKLKAITRHTKMIQMLCHNIQTMLLFGQVSHMTTSSHLFWKTKDPMLAQTLSYRRKRTYRPLLIDFSQTAKADL